MALKYLHVFVFRRLAIFDNSVGQDKRGDMQSHSLLCFGALAVRTVSISGAVVQRIGEGQIGNVPGRILWLTLPGVNADRKPLTAALLPRLDVAHSQRWQLRSPVKGRVIHHPIVP